MVECLFDETEAARRLGVSRRTLQHWRWKGGGPPFVKLGAAVRYRPADLVAWLDAHTRGNTAEGGLR